MSTLEGVNLKNKVDFLSVRACNVFICNLDVNPVQESEVGWMKAGFTWAILM